MKKIYDFVKSREEAADKILRLSRVREIWEEAGAEVRPVGSLPMGLLCRHRDIDLHVYSKDISTESSFAVMSRIAADPRTVEIKIINGLHTDEHCIAWHIQYRAEDDQIWQIDIIHIEKGSRYDGFFEEMTRRIKALLTPQLRATILRLKYETPADETIHGVEYYQAVIEDNVSTLPQLRDWLATHRAKAQAYWMPDDVNDEKGK